MTLRLPTRPAGAAAPHNPEFVRSGAYRTMRYEDWLAQETVRAAQEGRRFDAPTREDLGAHVVTDRDEIPAWFRSLVSGTQETAEERSAREETEHHRKVLSDATRRFAAGDADAFMDAIQSARVLRAEDPMFPNGVDPLSPDYSLEFPTPVDTTEIITLCEEVSLMSALPEITNNANVESWREMTQLEFLSGCADVAFPKGDCPEQFTHDGELKSVSLKHIGVEKSLTESDILASSWSIQQGYGVNELVGPFTHTGLPGEDGIGSMNRARIASLQEKEMRLGLTLVMNGNDQLLVDGNSGVRPDEFDGLVTQITAANGARSNAGTTLTGTFSATQFDQFLAAGCALPDAIIGHPTALQAIAMAYFGIGTQTIFYDSNQRIVPGINFAGEIITSFGRVMLIADNRFPRTSVTDGTFRSTVYPVRLSFNGEPLIYQKTQIPLSVKNLAPGCTAVKFVIVKVTALIVKGMCAQSAYTGEFNGMIDDSCDFVHPCIS